MLDPQDVAVGGVPTEPKKKRRWLSWLWKLAVLALVLPIVQVAILRVINPPFTTMMLYKSIEHIFTGEGVLWSHSNLSRNEIPNALMSSVVASEDQRFYQHNGFDRVEIDRAIKAHERHPNRPMRGASTISQQTAKNLFLPPVHSFVRKGVEAYYTVLMEWMWPKERILQTYLNTAEFAPNVYGAEAGAMFHFHKHASQLTAQQAAQLAAVLPNPKRWSASHPSAYIQRRSARILRQMRGVPTDEEEDGEPD